MEVGISHGHLNRGANRLRNRGVGPHLRLGVAIILLAVVLAACGKDGGSGKTPTRSPNPGPRPTVAGTAAASGVTVGDLADQVAAAWAGVKTYRATFVTSQSLGGAQAAIPDLRHLVPALGLGTPGATPKPSTRVVVETSDEIARPDRKRRLIVVNGRPVVELIAVGKRVFIRTYAPGPGGRGTTPGMWTELDRTNLDATTPLGGLVAGLDAAGAAPLAQVSAATRARPLKNAGPRAFGQRTCAVYSAVTTTQTGERVDVAIAVAVNHLPCSIQTSAGGIVGVTTYDAFNQPLTIAAPLATPAARAAAP